MKKYLSLALIALTIITACICLVSCKNDETPMEVVLEEIDKISFKDKTVVYNGKPKNITVTTRLQYNRLPAGIKVRYEGNGNVEVGEYEVKAIFSKDGVDIPDTTKTAKLTIKKAVYDLSESLEKFVPTTVSYNGQEQTFQVVNERYLPEGVSVTYAYPDGTPKVAGQYRVTAKFTHTNDKNYEPIPDQTVTLTVEPKAFDTSGFSFNRTFTIFDGSNKTVKITGTLPEGLKVRYEPENGVISVGEHTVRAIFYTEDENYKAPDPMVTTLTILNEDYSSSDALAFVDNADKSGYIISAYTGNANYLILPETYNGKPVTGIAKGVFKNQSFIYVYMPDTIVDIGSQAFLKCVNLKELHLSANLKTLGEEVFKGCTGLEAITLPDGVTEIQNSCFEDCSNLASVTLGSKVTTIGSAAFRKCGKLDKIFLPKTVTTISCTKAANAPFRDTADNFMVVLEDIKAGDNFSEYWTRLSTTDTTKTALVLYNQSYEQYITGHVELRNADKTTALANGIVTGSTALLGFDSNVFEYTAFANIYYGYPTVSVNAASPAALVTIDQATEANGGIATITIVSADGSSTKTYTVTFITIGEFNSTAEVVNKNNANGAVSFVIDDGYEPTANFAKGMLEKYSYLSLSFAIKTYELASLTEATDPEDGKNYYVMEDDGTYKLTENETKVNFWKGIINGVEGRAEIVSHSHTHVAWGLNDDGGEWTYVNNSNNILTKTFAKGSSSKELYASKQIISKIFPEMKNVGFIMPGIGIKTSNYVKDGVTYPTFQTYFTKILNEALKNQTYIGSRGTFSAGSDYTSRVVTKDNIISMRANLPGLMVKKEDSVLSWTDYIDRAAEMNGLAIFCIHAIGDVNANNQGGWVIPEDMAEELFKHPDGKNIWVATYSDALLYFTEWASAKVSSKYISAENKVEVILTDAEENNEMFNMALTVKVTIPVIWETATDGTNDLEIHTAADGSKYVLVDIIPDAGAVYLTKK